MQHGAHLEIESKENQGSTFKVIFPKERLYHMS
jgi:two-component system phosphate regulon sensor histidine kinase PhoR